MLLGIGVGWLLRNKRLTFLSGLIMGFILLLLFLLGTQVGANNEVMDNLSTLGVESLIVGAVAVLGSVLLNWWVYIKFFKTKNPDER